MFGGPKVVDEVDLEDEELEFAGDEVDGGVGEDGAVISPNLVELFLVCELDGGEKLSLLVIKRNVEGIEFAVCGVLNADQSVDFDRGGSFCCGVVIEGASDEIPAGVWSVEAKISRFANPVDLPVVDTMNAEVLSGGIAKPTLCASPLVGAGGEVVEVGGVKEPCFCGEVGKGEPESGEHSQDHGRRTAGEVQRWRAGATGRGVLGCSLMSGASTGSGGRVSSLRRNSRALTVSFLSRSRLVKIR